MQIAQNKFVSLAYELEVEGDIIDKADAENPLQFIFGVGMLLPKFEANIEGKKAGDTFKFTLSPADGYGEISPDVILEFPVDMFEINGKLEEDLLVVDNIIPMQDKDGNQLNGVVKELKDETVVMDFNHPLAGCVLNFSGSVLELRDATEEELSGGCHCDCDCDCSGGEQHDCQSPKGSCDCGCH